MLKLSFDDIDNTNEVIEILMGDQVTPRREFIQSNANLVQNLDV